MTQSRHHLAEVIAERTMHLHGTHELAEQVAAYLLEERLTAELDSLVRDIMQYRVDHGIIEAVAVSAHELTPQVVDDIKQLLKEHYSNVKTVTVDPRFDPAVIGGVRIDLANEQLDLTTRGKLNKFKRLTGARKE